MSSTNSKNFTYLIMLGCIVLITFTYVIVSNHLDNTINTDVKEVKVEE